MRFDCCCCWVGVNVGVECVSARIRYGFCTSDLNFRISNSVLCLLNSVF